MRRLLFLKIFFFGNVFAFVTENRYKSKPSPSSLYAATRVCRARDLVQSLIEDEDCFTTISGSGKFAEACSLNVVYEDRFLPQPVVGRANVKEYLVDKIEQRLKAKSPVGFRIDKISDGNRACGFAWTWTCGDLEGLRGTSFVELNENGEIAFVSEIPEPIFKPGDSTKDLLKIVTAGAEPKPIQPYTPKSPSAAHEIAKYLYLDLQNADPVSSRDELVKFLDENIIYRDFNYEDVLQGPAEVRQFVEEFSFPGIEFRPNKFDDGIDSTCFTWEVVLNDAPDTIHGMSFYELDPVSRRITYCRDVPESAIKPPILGKLARQLRPGVGVFQAVPLGSRPGGM
jgi:hypothetical protein